MGWQRNTYRERQVYFKTEAMWNLHVYPHSFLFPSFFLLCSCHYLTLENVDVEQNSNLKKTEVVLSQFTYSSGPERFCCILKQEWGQMNSPFPKSNIRPCTFFGDFHAAPSTKALYFNLYKGQILPSLHHCVMPNVPQELVDSFILFCK